ncbi:glycerol channel [Polyrhizophydium stewartii]|uniref:Glycerol channel n=1 Tax=Polyrhizophydium stewartii TaxID=2732419 RepID=A0ABR4N0L1_9FUNG|nr:hypothetical protein HK105_000182 [Polyrhizophydium stewartii]
MTVAKPPATTAAATAAPAPAPAAAAAAAAEADVKVKQEHPAQEPPAEAAEEPVPDTLSLEVVTEHLGFAPVHFVDDVIDQVNRLIYASMSKLEALVAKELGAGFETDKGMLSIESLFETCVDKRFDRFEVFSLRNVFAVPAKQARQLALMQQGCDEDIGPEDEQILDAEIDELRKRLLACEYMQAKMDEEEAYLDATLAEMNALCEQLGKLEVIARSNQVHPLSDAFTTVAANLLALQDVTHQVHVRSTHSILRERIAESDKRLRLMQSEIVAHIRKRKQMDDINAQQQQQQQRQQRSSSSSTSGATPGKPRPFVGTNSVSAWDVTREYRDANAIGTVDDVISAKRLMFCDIDAMQVA